MTLRHFRIFVTVCNHGSITKASEILYIAQPSVSLAIKELENNYGIKLFDRMSRKVIITEAGKKFFEYASHILALLDEIETSANNWNSEGTIRVGTSITIANYLLPLYMNEFKRGNPQTKIYVNVDNSKKVEDLVIKNEVDFALVEGNIHNNSIIAKEKFMNDELVLVCGPNHPYANIKEIDLDTIKTQDFILREKGSANRDMFDGILHLNGIEITPAWQSISTHVIIEAVRNGFGISVLPYFLVKIALDRDLLHRIKIKNILMKREYSIIYHKNKVLTNSMKTFMEICKNTTV